MEKPGSASGVSGTIAYNTVFIDTNLDTHLVMIIFDTETVSDLKKKIQYEHPLCFPNIGDVKIHTLKVKRRGKFYHLSDSMFVKSAFDGVGRSWFLSVDVSSVGKYIENMHPHNLDSDNQVTCFNIRDNPSANAIDILRNDPPRRLFDTDDVSLALVDSIQRVKSKSYADQFVSGYSNKEVLKDSEMDVEHNADNHRQVAFPGTLTRSDENTADDHCKVSITADNRSNPELQEKYNDLGTHTGCVDGNSRNEITDVQGNLSLEGDPKTESILKRKRKRTKKNEDALNDHALEENDASVHASGTDALQSVTVVPENSLGNVDRVVSFDVVGDKNAAKEPCRSSSSDVNKRYRSGVQVTNVQFEVTEVPGEHVVCETDKSKNDVVNIQGNKSLEEASSEPLAKKKRKMKKKDGNEDCLTDYTALISDSIKETSRLETTSSQYSLRDQQKGSNATLDLLSTDPLEANHLLTARPSAGKGKRKKKPSNHLNQVVAAISSSDKDVVRTSSKLPEVGVYRKDLSGEPDAALAPGQVSQGGMISEEAWEKDIDAGNAGSKKEAPTLATASASENHHITNVEVYPDLVVQKVNNSEHIGVSGHETVVINDQNKPQTDQTARVDINDQNRPRTDQTARVDEERELSQSNDPKATTSIVERDVSTNGAVEPGKSLKRRKKSKKTQDPVGGTQIVSGKEHVKDSVSEISATKPAGAVNGDYLRDDVEKEETDNVIQNVLDSLKQSTENRENSEKTGDKPRKKTKRKQSATAINVPELQTVGGNVARKDPALLTDNIKDIDDSSKLSKMTKLVKTSSMLNETNSELKNNTWVENDHTQLSSKVVGSSHTLQCNQEEGPSQDIVNSDPSKNGTADESNDCVKVSCASERIDVNDKFVSSQPQYENVASGEMLVDKVTNTKGVNELKGKKKKKKLDLHSGDHLHDSCSLLKSNENQSGGGKAQAANSGTTKQQRSLSEDESDNNMPDLIKKFPEVSESGPKCVLSNKIGKLYSVPEEAQRPSVVHASRTRIQTEKNKEACVASNSSFESSKEIVHQNIRGNNRQSRVQHSHVSVRRSSRNNNREIVNGSCVSVRKASGNNNGAVVNKSEHRKSLLAISGLISKDDINGNSEDEDGVDSSDASTRTPSDVSSDYSDENSDAYYSTPKNGSYSSHGKQNGGGNTTKSFSTGPKNMTLDKILRSSSRFKKAKLTASQSQLDNDSLLDEIIPDGQAN